MSRSKRSLLAMPKHARKAQTDLPKERRESHSSTLGGRGSGVERRRLGKSLNKGQDSGDSGASSRAEDGEESSEYRPATGNGYSEYEDDKTPDELDCERVRPLSPRT